MNPREPDSLMRLRQAALFGALDESQLRKVRARMEVRRFARGESIFEQDDPADYLYLITAGYVRIWLVSMEGREITLRVYGPGASFGELAVLDGEPRSASAEARSDVTTLVLSRVHFLELLREHFALVRSVIGMLTERVRYTTLFSHNLAFLSDIQRLAGELVRRAEDLGATSGPITLVVTQEQLARDTGVTREWINKALKRELAPMVETQLGKLQLLDLDGLRHWAAEPQRREKARS